MDNPNPNISRENICKICSMPVFETSIKYVKCKSCQLHLHSACALNYLSTFEVLSDTVPCPKCKCMDSLVLYETECPM